MIDLLGIGFEIYLSMLFYSTFWASKTVKKTAYAAGFFGIAVLCIVLIHFFQKSAWLPICYLLVVFFISFYFQGRFSLRILLGFILGALMTLTELVTGVVMAVMLDVPTSYFSSDPVVYGIGMLGSKAFALILIRLIRFFHPAGSQPFDHKGFNAALLLFPLQSFALCFVVQELIQAVNDSKMRLLGIFAIAISFLLIFVTTFILGNQLRSMAFRQRYEFARYCLQTQIEQYNELCAAQNDVRSIRHDMKNELIAISGLLANHERDDAVKRINKMQERIQLSERVVNTGFAAVDAILGAKIKKAEEAHIAISHKILIDQQLFVDQFDIAIILANAIDNALEAVERSPGVDTDIHVAILSRADYLSILVENHTAENIRPDLRTSKGDRLNHGFGIPQMKMIATQYDGSLKADFDPEKGKFSLKILLKNQSA